jgi:hypothetical protein
MRPDPGRPGGKIGMKSGSVSRLGGFFERGLFAPFLLAIQPVLQLYLINIAEMDLKEIVRSLLAALLVAVLVFGISFLLLRNGKKASLLASLFILFFFLFGDIADWISGRFEIGPARTNLLVLVFVASMMLPWYWMIRTRLKNVESINLYFNLLSILFLVSSVIQMGIHLLDNGVRVTPSNRSVPVTKVQSDQPRPDVYYIILDGYGRQDILQSLYAFDNSEFINDLSELGFYVADDASSNYIQTMLSLSSSLNMGYLQDIKLNGNALKNRGDLVEILNYSDVRSVLAKNGYKTISFHNEYKAAISSADVYYDNTSAGFIQPITAFESIVVNHSMMRILSLLPAFNRILIETPYDTHRQYILSTFDGLQEIPAWDGDYFVYAHVIAPHPPFVLDEYGNAVPHDEPFTLFDANYYMRDHSQKSYIAGYRKQIQYINSLALETVRSIIAHSQTPPIIIIQGDHGPGAHLHWGSLEKTLPAERFGILNVYYFPDQNYSQLYPSISPVNSFRVVLNQFFNGKYELVPDQHYYSSWSFPFDFIEVRDVSLP